MLNENHKGRYSTPLSVLGSTLAAAGMLALSGCASRPTATDLGAAIREADPQQSEAVAQQSDCMAEFLIASELSDTTLSGMAEDFANPKVVDVEADEVAGLVRDALNSCTGTVDSNATPTQDPSGSAEDSTDSETSTP